MKDRNGQPLQPRSVPVGSDGQPERPLPPVGSYARQFIERQRAETAQQRASTNPQSDAPPDEQPTPSPDEQPPAGQQPPADPQLTPNAQRRFGELAQTLRQKDQELQALAAKQKQLEDAAAADRARAEAAEARFQTVVQQNLEQLDPETRQRVMQEAQLEEGLARMESRLMSRIAPVLDATRTRFTQSDLERVAEKYPAFDLGVHGPLVEMFRERNPNCSVEQAFRAIAEPEELVTGSGRASAPPPIANPAPGNGSPRYVPQHTQQTSIEQEVEEERKRAFELARTTNARDRRHVGPAFDRLIKAKLGGAIPDTRPSYRGR